MKGYYKNRQKLLKHLNANTKSAEDFCALAIKTFHFQYTFNPIYQRFVDLLNIDTRTVSKISDIPFLPVSLYKNNKVKTGEWKAEEIFYSSSTTSMRPSQNEILDLNFYLQNTIRCFETTIGDISDYKWYALLPSYLERNGSSLVFMAEHFMQTHKEGRGGFFLHDHDQLINLLKNDNSEKKKILLGVSFALLDLAMNGNVDLSNVIIMETGGMKGRSREIPRNELHEIFQRKFNVSTVWSEYGMTELMSQAYSRGEGVFILPDTMEVLISDLNDPIEYLEKGKQGRINIIDLANLDTCSFLATDDLGVKLDKGQFRVLGRADVSEMRGCNLLVAD